MSEFYEPPLLSDAELEKGRRKIAKGYPEKRLIIPRQKWDEMVRIGEIVIPEGPWSVTNHPGIKPEELVDADPIYTIDNPVPANLVQTGEGRRYRRDTAGRLLHPRAAQIITTVGMYTQPGSHLHYGSNPISNFGLRRERDGVVEYAAVGVDRGEPRLRWGLPGGYAKPGELPQQAGAREFLEETGVDARQLGGLAIRQVDTDPHPWWKNTLHAWTEESYHFARSDDDPGLDGIVLDPQDAREVVQARWMSLEEINDRENNFLGAHRDQVNMNEATLLG